MAGDGGLEGSGETGSLAAAWMLVSGLAAARGAAFTAAIGMLANGALAEGALAEGAEGGVSGGGAGSWFATGGRSAGEVSPTTGAETGVDFTVVARRVTRPVTG